MIAAALTSIALLPGILTPTVAQVKTQTPLPILLPDKFPTDAKKLYPSGSGDKKSYEFSVAYTKDCGGANACFGAEFTGMKGGKPFGSHKATLAHGISGRYQPLSCGASCSPPIVSWKENGVTYEIQASAVAPHQSSRALLVKMANEAITRGPR
jgi:hypothetical protein